MLKKLLVHTRRGIKFIVLFIIAVFLIVGAIAFLYKPTYSVWLGDEQIGYTENKSTLQHTINEYVESGDGDENIAFVQVNKLPEYKLCLLKKDIVSNDEEILGKVKEDGIAYYRYYAIAEKGEEKLYVLNFEEAESVVNKLKEKNSNNIEDITILEKYETEMADIVSSEDAVAKLYVEKPKVVTAAKNKTNTYKSTGSVNITSTMSGGSASIGISLIRPVSGIITSRFGAISKIRTSAHTGLDISAAQGTPIKAAAAGTVVSSGWNSHGYGNMVVISHGNGVQTYYAHCLSLYVTAGQQVSQGQTIAAVGSTGNSTGPHLHLEVRVNGVAYNPQNYVY